MSGLLVSGFECPECRELIDVHYVYRSVFFVVILLITVPSVLAVLIQQGVYAALLWAPFPIGALGFVKARFCPLQVRRRDSSRRASDA